MIYYYRIIFIKLAIKKLENFWNLILIPRELRDQAYDISMALNRGMNEVINWEKESIDVMTDILVVEMGISRQYANELVTLIFDILL